ncbi:MAG: ABC transporter substrate-binding protein [Thermoplasmata archaeon]
MPEKTGWSGTQVGVLVILLVVTNAVTGAVVFFALPAAPGTAAITIYHPWAGSERDQFLTVLDAFTEKTGILVEDRTFRQEQLQTLLPAQFSASTTPADVIFMASGFIRDWGDQGWAMDVTSRIDTSDYIPEVTDPVTSGTTIWGAPYTYKPKPGFWFKDSFFTAKGYNQNPTTYTEFVALLDDIMADGMVPLVTGNGVGWPLSDMTEHFIATYGGAQMHRDLTAGTLSWTDASVKTVFTDFLVPLITAGYFDSPVAFDAGLADLWAENNAMYFQGSFILGFSQIEDASDMRFMAAPGGVATAGQVLSADYLFVPSFTTKQTEALMLFDFLKGVEGQEAQISQPGHFPTFVNVDVSKAHPCCDPSSVGTRIPLPDMDDTVGGTWQTAFWAQLQLLWANPGQLDTILAAIQAAR